MIAVMRAALVAADLTGIAEARHVEAQGEGTLRVGLAASIQAAGSVALHAAAELSSDHDAHKALMRATGNSVSPIHSMCAGDGP